MVVAWESSAMLIGSILLAVAALVVVTAAVCWLAGVQLMALVKVLLGVTAVVLTLAGAVVVTGDLLMSAGYLKSGRVDPEKPIQVPPLSNPLPVTETQRLSWLHHNAVGTFVAGPGFGMARMPVNIDDLLGPPKSLSDRDVASRDFGPPLYMPDPEPGQKPKNVHHPVQKTVGRWGMEGVAADDQTEHWKLRKLYLVGLVTNSEPTVYLTDAVPNMKEPKDVPTRGLDDFEKAALEALRGGENLKVEKRGNEIRMMGSIYAGKSCVKCHDQKGQLLGAFTYYLELVPVENPQTK
jgi:hypothetical protein